MSTLRHRLVAATCAVSFALAACGSAPPSATVPSATAPSSPSATAAPSPTVAPPAEPTPAASPSLPAYLDDLQAVLAATAGVGSARIAYEIGFDGSTAAPDGALMSGSGEFVTGDEPRARIDMDMSAAGLGRLDVIQNGDIMYMKGDAFKALDPAGRWIRIDTTSDHPNAVAFSTSLSQSTDPWASLGFLLGANDAPTVLASDTIGGDPVRHLRFRADLDQAVERAPAASRDYLLLQAANFRAQGIAPDFQTDVWVDDSGRIHRAVYAFDMSALKGGGTMYVRYDLSDFGKEVAVPIPDAADVVSIEELELNPGG